MKEYIQSKRANPTTETQERILKIVRESEKPLTLSTLATASRTSFYQAKATIEFFVRLGILKTIVSSGNTTLVFLNKQVIQNAGATNTTIPV